MESCLHYRCRGGPPLARMVTPPSEGGRHESLTTFSRTKDHKKFSCQSRQDTPCLQQVTKFGFLQIVVTRDSLQMHTGHELEFIPNRLDDFPQFNGNPFAQNEMNVDANWCVVWILPLEF